MRNFLGVDVGGTKVAVAAVAGGEARHGVEHPTALESSDALLAGIEAAVREVAAQAGEPQAIGVGVPSQIEWASGTVVSSVNIPLAGVPLRDELSERFGVPVYVDNDASCAALAEAFDERGRLTCAHLVMFTIGTGVGGGPVLNGKLYRGAVGMAAEVGHTIVGLDLTDGAPAADGDFPQDGSLELLASGRALDSLALAGARADANSFLGRRLTRDGGVTGHDVVDGARSGDAGAIRALEILGQRLGIGVANAINTFDPLEVVIGGGVSAAGDLLLDPARETARRHVVPGAGSKTTLRLARHGPRAGVLGAALIAAQEWAEEQGKPAGAEVAAAKQGGA